VENIRVDISVSSPVSSYKPTGFYTEDIGDNRINWKGDLRTDREFKIIKE
jgi:hypothetical protein